MRYSSMVLGIKNRIRTGNAGKNGELQENLDVSRSETMSPKSVQVPK